MICRFILLAILLIVLRANELHAQESTLLQGDFDALQPHLSRSDDTLRVVNFWATWCTPCVKELPYFLRMEKKYKDAPVRFLYVSLDFKKDVESKLIPFIKEKMNRSSVFWLYDLDMNSWIAKVSPQWGGAIPATLLYRKKTRNFVGGAINQRTLDSLISTYISAL